ncbi:mitochondrial Rho GTPase 1-like [Lycium barbarum]|uniref:mitochondrial Rho GTPase 1-like n=1 Tax=Lycium barbarum TaxID=112863 RepID=UPI00293E04AB|nr:mitochondrial Rho GTPase 1-like [Lycium barbarum]
MILMLLPCVVFLLVTYLQCLGAKKSLVLREIPEDGVNKLLSSKDALADCDIAIFVHDRSRETSWKRASDLLVDVASHGEATGYEVPCLIVAAKDDLDPYSTEIQDSTRVAILNSRGHNTEGCRLLLK